MTPRDRVQEIIEEMNQLVAESRDLARKHDEIVRKYERLKLELDSIRRLFYPEMLSDDRRGGEPEDE